ncbi:N-acylglucosamine 2-epimerase (GlcNAc 2-epimerase) [Mariniphaga anaerophila]|uniref:N-acylglucosamine 2-epimerase (GlcNAc 2-epimerase) n=1 Tax=Mariniphaga anaerophila TaxID=1484053 RepID=A0A1M4SSH2_9BACT|nr:AGE family epimerase/isomerase [Mariniphaga anaerophila]SHE34947.1 N-acylglucosamine 2-epimerase (GlcNAc 2-epimerase) [Mariniphaga anaerophila]
MQRKKFLKLGGGILLSPTIINDVKLFNKNKHDIFDKNSNSNHLILDRLGGMSLPELLDFHRNYLYKTYIPNWERGVDWDNGGFADSLKPGQEPDFEKKSMYYQGRAIWMFSYLYNHVTKNKLHLDAAINGRNFVVKHALLDDFRWNSILERQGNPLSGPVDHYGDIYMVLGLSELYKATSDEKDLNIAINTVHSILKRLVSPIYQHTDAHGPAMEPGIRRLGGWQHLLYSLSSLLRVKYDQEIEQIARFCVRMICEYHWIEEYKLLFEYLDINYKQYISNVSNWGGSRNLRSISGWHSIQACWMVMDEAHRVKHYPTYRHGIEMGFSTLEKCYVDGKGIITLKYPEEIPKVESEFDPWGALDDVLLFCLMVIENNHHPDIIRYYNKCFSLYHSIPDNYRPEDLLHLPRQLFYSIEIINRIIKQEGKVKNAPFD